MALDLRSLFGHHVLFSLAESPQPPLPPHLDSYTRALLASQDRRHLIVTPWFQKTVKMGARRSLALLCCCLALCCGLSKDDDFHDMGMDQHDFHDMGLGQPVDKSDWVDPFNMGDLEDRVRSF